MEYPKLKPTLEHLTKGDIIVIPADQVPGKDFKDRRYVVLWEAETDTYAVCPITSKAHREHKIALELKDVSFKALTYDPSYARPNLIQTLQREPEWRKVGTVSEEKMQEMAEKVRFLLDKGRTEAPVKAALQRADRQRVR